MSGRPRRACDHCNLQKVRCSGHRPSCQRCLRTSRLCLYGKSGASKAVQASLPASHSRAESSFSIPRHVNAEKSYIGIPTALIPALVELYFSHVYNSSLLLHKPTFLHSLATGSVRPHVLLSVCAFATKFYRDAADNATLAESGFGCEWAERATRLVFQEADEPEEENIPAFMNLALFWYSQGMWRKSNMLKCNGAQTAHILGLSIERPGTQDSLEAELSRRRFWACYLMEAHSSDTIFTRTPSETVSSLTLPCRDEDYNAGFPRDARCLSTFRSNGSVYGELVSAMTLWTAVYLLIKKPEAKTASRLAALQELDSRINAWWSSMSPLLALTPASISTIPLSILPRLLLIHIVYHQCLCALHSSIVPLYSWSTSDESCLYARQVSAQVALEHANAASALFDAALCRQWDASRIPSFVGYSAYCACAIQMPFMWCSNPAVRERAHRNVLVDLRMIQLLGKYWKLVAYLGVNVRSLHEMHARNPYPIDDEPKSMDASTLNGFKASAARARETILSHNQILWNKDGRIAQEGEDLPNLSVEDVNTSVPNTINAPNVVFITEMEEQERNRDEAEIGVAQLFDPYQSYLDPDMFNCDVPFSQPDETMAGWHMNSFEEWLDGLQFSAETAASAQA